MSLPRTAANRAIGVSSPVTVSRNLHTPLLGGATERLSSAPLRLRRSAFDNRCWPAPDFVEEEGIIRDHHSGGGRYEQPERLTQLVHLHDAVRTFLDPGAQAYAFRIE